MELNRVFVMTDPASDSVLSLCAGPTDDGKCPQADSPSYLCEGLHLVSAGGAGERSISFTVTETAPGRCPLA
jgi:hypothetical protein